ncbi:hypothetical protein RclHR1_03530018 [Rhizophagus clarus]|uniref:Uncharacterized protein n=1 Tax=Rhizophagus clarus TaxID=94130 RepID=A0A2Z6RSH9_9GLOM|nr:hypothetical protein RclHR1_03530018 [Rhizophagus clarus]GES96890.1 hypothetical protein GLOIN_2v1569202 [Rhizophagus clarus]
MFARDAIFNNERHEPWWFRLLRRTSAIVLVLAVVAYGSFQLLNLLSFVDAPNIVIIESKSGLSFPGFIICPGSLSPAFVNKFNNTEVPHADPQFSMSCGKSTKVGPEVLSENANYTETKCGSLILAEENGCLRVPPENVTNYDDSFGYYSSSDDYGDNGSNGNNSNNDNSNSNNVDTSTKGPTDGVNKTFIFYDIKSNVLTPVDLPTFYTVYFDTLGTYDYGYFSIGKDNKYVEYNNFPIIMGHRNILEFSISVHRVFSTNLMGQLDIRPDVYSMEFKVDTRSIPLKTQSSPMDTQLVILPKNPHFLRTEIEKYEYQTISIISNLGGFYGFIVTAYMALFGMSKIEPWGFLQKIIFRCWNCRRSFKQHLADKYVSSAGIPFGENICDRPEGTSLEDRLQILEYLLKDYYLDTYYLERLKITKTIFNIKDNRIIELESLIDTRDKAIENKERIEQQSEEDYLKEKERKRTAKRWSNWSRKFGFSSPSKISDDNIGINSIDSDLTSSPVPSPSPRKSRWSNLSILNYFGNSSNLNNIDEEIDIPSTSASTTTSISASTSANTSATRITPATNFTSSTLNTDIMPRYPFKIVVQDYRDSQNTLVEVKIDKN